MTISRLSRDILMSRTTSSGDELDHVDVSVTVTLDREPEGLCLAELIVFHDLVDRKSWVRSNRLPARASRSVRRPSRGTRSEPGSGPARRKHVAVAVVEGDRNRRPPCGDAIRRRRPRT